MKTYIFDTKNINADEKTFREALPQHEIIFIEDSLTPQNASQFADAEIISVFVSSKVPKEVFDIMPNLKFIAARSTGLDHIDQESAKNRGVIVKNVSGYGATTVAEFTFALIFALSRKVDQSATDLKNGEVKGLSHYAGFDLKDKKIAVIGTGAIGMGVIRISLGFGMKVFAHDAFPKTEEAQKMGFEYKTLKEAVEEADIVTLHVPATPETHHFINDEIFTAMKRSPILVNTARGDAVNTESLVKALENKAISGAVLDVYEGEEEAAQGNPSEAVKKLFSMNNVLITPHIAFASKEAIEIINQKTIENIKSL